MSFSYAEAFITLFIGVGPVKVLLAYISATQGLDKDMRNQMALRAVTVAGGVAIGLFVFGVFLQRILHFSIGALTIVGGLILLLLALRMVMGGQSHGGDAAAGADPLSQAVSPLGIPLMLNPVGIVALVVASAEGLDIPTSLIIIAMVGVLMAINLVVLRASDRVAKYLSTAVVSLFEVVLGILLGALAVQLILNGLAEQGIITMTAGH
jgi:multiple antibiotic resistance protein